MSRRNIWPVMCVLFLTASGCAGNESAPDPKAPVPAQVRVDPASQEVLELAQPFSLITATVTKDGDVPVKGSLNLSGGSAFLRPGQAAATFTVDLTSWNSNLAERDARVRGVFFEAGLEKFASASVSIAPLAPELLAELIAKRTLGNVPVTATVTLHGVSRDVPGEVDLAFTDAGRLRVTSVKPSMVRISEFGLGGNLTELKALCGHESVSDEARVDFELEFGLAAE